MTQPETEHKSAAAASHLQESYYIMTWGCQMNEEDSEQMGLFLERMGYRAAVSAEEADVVLLNTCSVRSKPEEKVWSELGRLREIKQQRPHMLLGVCGCMAQVESDMLRRRAPYIDIILGTGNLGALPELVKTARSGKTATAHASVPAKHNFVALTALGLPPRKGKVVSDIPERIAERKPKHKAHVPIMYGCDKFCTFCIVPHTRGRERSRPTADILAEIKALALSGTKEITLLGQTVNSYGKNLPDGRVPFAHLLKEINEIPGIERIRFTSPYPRDFNEELIEQIGSLTHVCEHVHLPLQVGDNALLAEMHRGYTVEEYCAIVEKLRCSVPGLALTTDIMLGFPGETEQQFQNTLHLIKQIRFDSAFMFAYSPRPGTPAALRADQVEQKTKIARLNQLIALQNSITAEINAEWVGKEVEVLVDGVSTRDPHRFSGYTRTLKLVHFTIPHHSGPPQQWRGELVQVHIQEAHLTGFLGEWRPAKTG